MKPDPRTPIGALRLAGFAEGVSFLVLTLVAMPIKYLAHNPLPVRIAGMAHGVLFILLCILLIRVVADGLLSKRTAALVFVAALLPAGPFFADRRIERETAGK